MDTRVKHEVGEAAKMVVELAYAHYAGIALTSAIQAAILGPVLRRTGVDALSGLGYKNRYFLTVAAYLVVTGANDFSRVTLEQAEKNPRYKKFKALADRPKRANTIADALDAYADSLTGRLN